MSIEQVQKLSSNVEKLTPILGRSIENLSKFSKNYVDSEKKNNEQLNELVSVLSSRKSESMIPPGIMEEMVGLRQQNSTYQQIIQALVEEREKMSEELKELFENMDPSALKTALGAAGLGVALGLPGMMPGGDDTGPEAMVTGGTLPSNIPQTSPQGWRWGKMHKGIDMDGGDGAPISSAQDATVVHAGDKGDKYGNSVVLKYSNGAETRFAHLKTINVRSGSTIKAGQLIGTQGNTGNSTASHLHFEYYPKGGAMTYEGYGDAASVKNSYFRYGGGVKPKPQQAPQLKPEEQTRKVSTAVQQQSQQIAQQQGAPPSSGGTKGSVQPNYLAVLQLASSK